MGKTKLDPMTFILTLVALVAAVLMAISFFLPYGTATESRQEMLERYADVVIDEDLGMTGEDMEEFTLVEYGRIFADTGFGPVQEDGSDTEARIALGLEVAMVLFLVLTVIFFLVGKPVVMLIFSGLLLGSTLWMDIYFNAGMNLIPTYKYVYGVGRYTCWIAAAALVVCAIGFLVMLHVEKQKALGRRLYAELVKEADGQQEIQKVQGIIAEKKEKTVSNKPVLRKPHREAMPFVLFLLGILATVGMVVSFFLPYSTATESHRELLEKYADEVIDEDLDMTGEDLEEISLAKYGRIFVAALGEDSGSASDAKIFLGIFVIEAAFLVLTMLFFLKEKPVRTLIFSLLLLGMNFLMGWLFRIGGYVPSSNYSYGFGRDVSLVIVMVLVACAIALLAACNTAKRINRRNLTPPAPVETAVPAEAVEN